MINRLLFPLFLICGIASTPVFSAESSGIAEDLSEEDKLYGLSLFWKEASYNFAFFDQVPNLDFDSAYREYIPRVLATENTYEYYRELMKFNALLQDGHTNVYLPEGLSAQYEDWPAVYMTEANQEAIVTKVDVALQAEIPLGSSIISVEGVDLETHLKTNIMPYIASSTEHILWDLAVKNTLDGPADSTVNFTIKTPSGELKEVSLRRNSRNKNIEVASLELPKIDISLKMLPSDMELFEFRWLENDLAYIALNGFHDEAIVENFKAAYPEIKKAKGLIIDLRFNGGGNSNIGAEILSYLT
ncbi:MAG: S41 family peptidase, partial [Ekhidna sp.]